MARNYAATVANGEYLLFMDDDNVALPDATKIFERAARVSGADFLTCVAGIHPHSEWGLEDSFLVDYAREVTANCRFWGPPIGPSVSLGLFYNCFGDCNALARKSTFLSLGGFKSFMYEDLELFMRAVLEGARFMVIPEILYLYRFHNASRSRTERLLDGCMDTIQSVLDRVPASLHPMVLTCRSQMLANVVRERHFVLSQTLKEADGFNGNLEEFLWSSGDNAQARAIFIGSRSN